MAAVIDLNADLGEGVGDDAALLPLVTSANVACGFHAGDAWTMRTTLSLAAENGVTVGAHPSYRDREGFGRRDLEVDPATLRRDVDEQLAAILAAARDTGVEVAYLKPHGALYNRIARDRAEADVVAAAAADSGLPILGLPGTAIARSAAAHGVDFFAEAFADRGYRADGTLAAREAPGGVLHDPDAIAARVVRLATEGVVDDVDGGDVVVQALSVCVHGDTPGAVEIARSVRAALADADVAVRSFA